MSKALLNVVLLLDNMTRLRMRVNVSVFVDYGVKIVSSLKDINDTILEKTRTVVVLEDFLRKQNNYSDLVLWQEALGLEYIYLGADETLLNVMRKLGNVYATDPTVLDYDSLYSFVYNDLQLQNKYSLSKLDDGNSLAIAKQVMQDVDSKDEIRNMASSYLALDQVQREVFADNERLLQTISGLEAMLQTITTSENGIKEAYIEVLKNARELNRTLKQFEPILTNDVYDKISLNKYDKRPTIIYLKEYQELAHLDSFIETLFKTLVYQYKHSVKVLRLHDSSSSKRLLTVSDNKYFKLKNNFLRSEVLSNDFLLKVGGYKQVVDLIFNSVSLDILIVVDCKDHDDLIFRGGQFLQLGMCRDSRHLGSFALDPASTIVNNQEGNPLSWDHYDEYTKLSPEELFLFLSSRPVIQSIYELLSGYTKAGV